MILKIIVILISLSFSKAQLNTVRKTQYGPVRGKMSTSRANPSTQYLSFFGIPYAAPPVGKLRFKEPQPPQPLSTVQLAVAPKPPCMQAINRSSEYRFADGSEDCLYLNVFIPVTAASNLEQMPVMVWIHGGNWFFSSANDEGPDYFMEKPVVIVTVEYRLNVFGFFTTLDDNAKGNMGLKDQVLALKWIQNNIENFNGDSSRVTIFGSGSGSISLIFHMLSPLSKGLFSGVIGQTGSPLSGWAIQRNPMEKTRKLLKAFRINSTNNAEIVEKLQTIDARTLLQTALNYSVMGYYTFYETQLFAPIIERESSTSFLSQSPHDLLESGRYNRVPLIMGFNSQEGENSWAILTAGNKTDLYKNNPRRFIPKDMNIPKNSPCINRTLNNIIRRYFPDGNYSNPHELIPYLSLDYVIGILEAVYFLEKEVSVYLYYISYVGSRNMAYLRPRGVQHTEELQYMWYPLSYGHSPNETAADKLTRQRIVTLWTNFATERNPTPRRDGLLQNVKWPPTEESTQYYININSTLMIESPIPYTSEMPFWVQQFQTCGFQDPNPNN